MWYLLVDLGYDGICVAPFNNEEDALEAFVEVDTGISNITNEPYNEGVVLIEGRVLGSTRSFENILADIRGRPE